MAPSIASRIALDLASAAIFNASGAKCAYTSGDCLDRWPTFFPAIS